MNRAFFYTTLASLALAAGSVAAGCGGEEAFCFNCEGPPAAGGSGGTGPIGIGGKAGSGGQMVLPSGGSGGSAAGGAATCVGADLMSDPQNCGACGVTCDKTGVLKQCVKGACSTECAPGNVDLNKKADDGCEYACAVSNKGKEVCDGIDNDCNGKVDDGVDTSADPFNCGKCGNVCLFENGTAKCVAGKCEIDQCFSGFADDPAKAGPDCALLCVKTNGGKEVCNGIDDDCNGKVDDDADTSSDPLNCGACGSSCVGVFPHMPPRCEAGKCVPGDCTEGYVDKNGDPSDGCEYNCTLACSFPFATPICGADGSCSMGSCLPNYFDINSDSADGCEYFCVVSNNGKEACDLVDNDCDGKVDEPEEVDVLTDPANCGACKASCAGKFANAQPTCQAGKCVFGACEGGYIDKNNDPADGCEYSCETICSFPFGVSQCDAQGNCSLGGCQLNHYDLNNDPADGCEYACIPSNPPTEVCDGKDNDCNGQVDDNADTTSDPLNCGACGSSCIGKFANAQPTCQASVCVMGDCLGGYFDKNNDPTDGCEFNCQATCSFPFATATCDANGGCSFGSCLLGHIDLNNDPVDGCEYACTPSQPTIELCDGKDNDCNGQVDEFFDLNSDPKNCGQCGNDCDPLFPNANTKCELVAGTPTCAFDSCKAGFFNDDGNTANGCEYDCTPSNGGVEKCDGVDNDCDGVADNPPGGVFDPPLQDLCDPADSVGECDAKTICVNGAPACAKLVQPKTEVCNGKDDNCDGQIDEGSLPLVGVACGTSQVGECQFGTTICQNGGIVCSGEVKPKAETCNNKDDDCDGVVDNNPTDVGSACGTATGACSQGTTQCVNGASQCIGGVGPAVEVCDGPQGTSNDSFDNNCNGQIDEGCVFVSGEPVRLDTLNSTFGQHSSFQLVGASTGDDFLVAYADRRTGSGDIYGRASTSAGSAWGANDYVIAGEGNVEVEPSLAMRPGRAYMAYSRFEGSIRRIQVRSATTPYSTWSNPVRADTQADGNIDCYEPQVVVAKQGASNNTDTIAVIWSEIGGTAVNPTRNIYLRYSTDSGASFKPAAPILVNTGGANKAELPVVATNGNGVVYIAWRDKRTAGLAQAYVGRIDVTAGSPAMANVQALQPPGVGTAASAEQIVIAADTSNNVHVGWVDLRPPVKTIRVSSSQDTGVTFTKSGADNDGKVVNPDGALADAAGVSIAARGGRVIAAWEDTRSGAADIRFNHSDDAGLTWGATTPRVDTGDNLGASLSVQPRVAFGVGDTVYVTWQDARFPLSSVIANVSIDRGTNFNASAGTNLRIDVNTAVTNNSGAAADSQYPLVLASPSSNRASVIWVDYRNATGANNQNGDIWTRLLQ